MTNPDVEAMVEEFDKAAEMMRVSTHVEPRHLRDDMIRDWLRFRLTALLEAKDKEIEAARQEGREDGISHAYRSVLDGDAALTYEMGRQEGRNEAVDYINIFLMWGRGEDGNLVIMPKHMEEVLKAARRGRSAARNSH